MKLKKKVPTKPGVYIFQSDWMRGRSMGGHRAVIFEKDGKLYQTWEGQEKIAYCGLDTMGGEVV